MKRTIATRLLLTGALSAAACGNDSGGATLAEDAGVNVDSGVPASDAGCGVEPTFTSIHAMILSDATSCAVVGCHGGRSAEGNLALDTGKSEVYRELVEERTGSATAVGEYPKRVVAMNPAQSFFFLKLTSADPPGDGDRMPVGCSERRPQFCLPQCEIDAFRTSIENGAQDD